MGEMERTRRFSVYKEAQGFRPGPCNDPHASAQGPAMSSIVNAPLSTLCTRQPLVHGAARSCCNKGFNQAPSTRDPPGFNLHRPHTRHCLAPSSTFELALWHISPRIRPLTGKALFPFLPALLSLTLLRTNNSVFTPPPRATPPAFFGRSSPRLARTLPRRVSLFTLSALTPALHCDVASGVHPDCPPPPTVPLTHIPFSQHHTPSFPCSLVLTAPSLSFTGKSPLRATVERAGALPPRRDLQPPLPPNPAPPTRPPVRLTKVSKVEEG